MPSTQTIPCLQAMLRVGPAMAGSWASRVGKWHHGGSWKEQETREKAKKPEGVTGNMWKNKKLEDEQETAEQETRGKKENRKKTGTQGERTGTQGKDRENKKQTGNGGGTGNQRKNWKLGV